MDAVYRSVGRRFWIWWAATSTIGLGAGIASYFLFVGRFAPGLSTLQADMISATGGALLGALLGMAQWIVIRHRVLRAGRWVFASTAGGAVAGALVLAVYEIVLAASTGILMGLVAAGAAFGASLGIAQWLTLHSGISRAGWWVLASTLALALGFVGSIDLYLGVFGPGAGGIARSAADALVGTVLMASYGGITGGVLIWLLRQPAKDETGQSGASA